MVGIFETHSSFKGTGHWTDGMNQVNLNQSSEFNLLDCPIRTQHSITWFGGFKLVKRASVNWVLLRKIRVLNEFVGFMR